MGNTDSVALMRIQDLIAAIGADRVSPGSGVAGAVTLALAAACAMKAAVISLKHQPLDSPLRQSQETLERIGQFALAGADRDAEAFTAFIRQQTQDAAAQLIREGDKTTRLADVLAAVLERIAPQVEANLAGDIVAARALLEAARRIVHTNCTEAREEQESLGHH